MTESEESAQRPPEDAVKDAISLLRNMVAQTSRIHHKRILKLCNSDLQNLADKDNLFEAAGQNLFGSKFEVRMKERAESVKLLSNRAGADGTAGMVLALPLLRLRHLFFISFLYFKIIKI